MGMRTKAMLVALALLVTSVFAAKGPLTGPLASPDHCATSGTQILLGALATRINELEPTDSRYKARAGALQLRAGLTAEADKTFTEAAALDANDDETCFIIAAAYRDMKMWDKADVWFKKATEADPKD